MTRRKTESIEERDMATATYEIINGTTAIITVDYDRGGFGMERVTVGRHAVDGDLYEAAYNAASFKARVQGEELTRFSRE